MPTALYHLVLARTGEVTKRQRGVFWALIVQLLELLGGRRSHLR